MPANYNAINVARKAMLAARGIGLAPTPRSIVFGKRTGGSILAGGVNPDLMPFSNVQLLLLGGETDGSSTIIDSSSFARTPTVNSTITYQTDAEALGGTALRWNSTADKLDYNGVIDHGGAGGWTAEFFVKNISAHTGATFYLRNTNTALGGAGEYAIYATSLGKLRVRLAGNSKVLEIALPYGTNVWHYICVVFTGTQMKLYCGPLAGTATLRDTYATTNSTWENTLYMETDHSNIVMNNLRFTKGAQYLEDYPVPTAHFYTG